MKLLIDHQLPPTLKHYFLRKEVEALHVCDAGLAEAPDRSIWEFASANGFDIVSKDEDFFYLASHTQAGPRLLWIRLGNCRTHVLFEALDRVWPRLEAWLKTSERIVEIR